MRLDVYEATKYTLSECEAIREYFAEKSRINLEGSESGNGLTIYDMAASDENEEVYHS